MSARKRLHILNAMAANTGDAAILQGTILAIESAAGPVDVSVEDPHYLNVQPLYPKYQFEPPAIREKKSAEMIVAVYGRGGYFGRLLLTLLSRLRRSESRPQAHLALSSGGTYFTDNYDISAKLACICLSKARNVRTLLYTQSIGPLDRPYARNIARRTLRRIDYAMVRDEASRRILKGLGVPGAKIRVGADPAFALGRDDLILQRAEKEASPAANIALSVREWPFFGSAHEGFQDRYVDAFAALVRTLVRDRGARVTFISTCQGTPFYRFDDANFAKQIAARLDEDLLDKVTIDSSFRTPEQFIDEISSFDYLIGMRMHATILSLCAGTPALPVVYENKTVDLFQKILPGFALPDIRAAEPMNLAIKFEEFVKLMASYKGRMFENVLELRQTAFQDAATVVERFLGPAESGR